jgi:hypothetical protein
VYFLSEFPGSFPKMNFDKFLQFLCVSACRAESIGILFVKIGTIVEKLFGRYSFTRRCPIAPCVKFGTFLIIPHFAFVDLNRSVC